MRYTHAWGDTKWEKPRISDYSERAPGVHDPNKTMRLHAEFDSGNDWDYSLALNGRKLLKFEIDGRRQVDAPETGWDGETGE